MADKPIVPDPDLHLAAEPYTHDDGQSVPSDEQQFEAYEAGHITAVLRESDRPNPLFRAHVGPDPQHILDVGTGKGSWAIDVADMFPSATVRGVDLFPPPSLGSIRPGGWVEQLEMSPDFLSDDGCLPPDSLAANLGKTCVRAAAKSGRPMDLYYRCTELIEKAGFTDIHVHECKWPLGPWARDKQLKEVGTVNFAQWAAGMEGYAMHLLTKYGEPKPWSKEEVMVYVAKVKNEKRVWARKPLSNSKESPATTAIKKENKD
ncbi:hypothetical protein N7499_003325 [Penicillium canescens]|uniref:S-adenosyl-L-methionine-dependent methyltransferase n=1 Tax=Penicillium canescens TaxID=5083 RepID=A0AAD6I9M1_PENCN|nr:uncharacterized protein N7446_012235 [Penicillium canescens]KAJ6020026.1 hypothetical protein N7522_000101 [Penicillium canescens]KAJ6037960.1 hypothetical protein N7460_007731 [Penicillium canescens]KAJ6045371.1 hypothetical protein N7446_012235 [Penicillium canescens]KAJ6061065.1 hypothetical protein N7444_001761 [Penicillium canescens]KAJ6090611.1 hypothetical protein N7499_003325 [Penicillium canescens]